MSDPNEVSAEATEAVSIGVKELLLCSMEWLYLLLHWSLHLLAG